jgi:hypothetical protein
MKKRSVIVSVTSFIILCSFVIISSISNNQTEQSDFFFWMESYIAAPVDSNFEIALTYYYNKKDNYIDINKISNIEFADIDEKVKIESYAIDKIKFKSDNEYKGYSFEMNLKFLNLGNFQTEFIKLHFENGDEIIYPIGKFVFDIDESEEDNPPINTWVSPVASADDEYFAYYYTRSDKNAVIEELSYGDSSSIYSIEGIELEKKIKLDKYNAPH